MSIIISGLRNREQNLVARHGKNRAGIWILRAAAVIRPTYRSRSATHTSWPLRRNADRRESKTASAVPGGGDRLPQRFALEISSVLQVPDGGLEQAEASARGFFGFPIALQLIFAVQAGPFIRIDGFNA
jgi:hypothetical protein